MADKKISALPTAATPLAGTEVLPVVQSGVTDKVSVANLTAGRTVAVGALTSSGTVSATASAEGANFSGLQVDNASAGSGSPANTVSLNFANFSVVKGRITAAVYGDGYMDFATDNDIAKMRITAGGDIQNNLGNFILGTAGKGIDFSANTHAPGMTSELLDWYEEGTWTPNVSFSGATSSEGTYTRIGRQVTVRGSLTGASLSFGATAIVTDNLPFSIASPSTGVMVDAANTNGCLLQATGIWLVAATTLTPGVSQVVFTATYFT